MTLILHPRAFYLLVVMALALWIRQQPAAKPVARPAAPRPEPQARKPMSNPFAQRETMAQRIERENAEVRDTFTNAFQTARARRSEGMTIDVNPK